MTAQQIADRVKEQADARLPEVIERLFPIARNIHAHDAWRGECECSYCHYIRHIYVPTKLQIHKLKKRIRYLEWCNNDVDIRATWATDESLGREQLRLISMKHQKKKLKED